MISTLLMFYLLQYFGIVFLSSNVLVEAQTVLNPSYIFQIGPNAVEQTPWDEGSYTTLSLGDDTTVPVTLPFTFYYYGVGYDTININTNGNLQFRTNYQYFYGASMPTDSSIITPIFAALFTDLYSLSSGSVPFSYRIEGDAPSRRFILRYYQVNICCVSGPGSFSFDIVLFETSNRIETRYYDLAALQYAVIGVERGGGVRSDGTYDYTVYSNYGPLTTADALYLKGKTLTWSNVANLTAPPLPLSYNVTRLNTVATAPANLTNEIFLPASDDSVDSVPLGFSFTFYGVSYTGINVSSNGDIQFETSTTMINPVAMPASTVTRAPFIAALNTNLWPQCSYCRSYGTSGVYPDRVFTLRYKDVPYYYYRQYTPSTSYSVFFDVLLFESNSTIEVRYYRVSYVPQYVVVGIQGSPVLRSDYTFDYTAVVNNQYLASIYTTLNAKTIQYIPAYTVAPPVNNRDNLTYEVQTISSVTARPTISTTSISCTDDGFAPNLPIGFNFTFYDRVYSSFGFSCNGNLQFLTTSTMNLPPNLPSGNTAFLPLMSFYTSDLNVESGGSMVYGNQGTAPNRELHVRLTNILFYGGTGNGVTLDVVLFEGTNRFEFRYHTVSASQYGDVVLIGIEGTTRTSTGAYDFAVTLNNVEMTSEVASNLQGKTIVYSPTPLPYTPPTPVPLSYTVRQARGANFTNLNASTVLGFSDESLIRVDLGFFFNFYGKWYNQAWISSNGEMHFANLPVTRSASGFPQRMGGFLPIIAFFFVDLYPYNSGINYQTMGNFPNRKFVLKYTNVQYYYCGGLVSFEVVLYEANGGIEFKYSTDMTSCQYVGVLIGIQGNAIRRADYTYDFASISNLLAADENFISSLRNTTFSFVPRVISAPPTPFAIVESPVSSYSLTIDYEDTLLTLDNPVPLIGGDDDVPEVALGFNFVFYGVVYQKLYLSGNGNVQFNTTSTTFSAPTMPTTTYAMSPFIGHFFTDLYSTAGVSKVYQTLGEPGYRKFVLRYVNIPYFSWRNAVNDIDLVLFEEDNHIEIHYHRVSTSGAYITIGMQGTGSSTPAAQQDYVVLNNNERMDTTNRASLLNGAVVYLRPKIETPRVPVPRYTYNVSTIDSVVSRPTLTSPVTLGTADDDANSYITLGFTFPFFGLSYTYCSISTNGNIQFVTDAVDPWASPLPTGDTQRVPAVFFAWTDLYPTPGAVRQYARQGVSPNREFFVRYTDVAYRTSLALVDNSSAPKLSVDVILYENGTIQFRYYRFDVNYAPVTIGIESALHADNSSEYYALLNALPVNSSISAQFLSKTVTFAYSNAFTSYVAYPDIPSILPTYYLQSPYQITHIRGVQREIASTTTFISFSSTVRLNMGFPFNVFGTNYTDVYVDRRGFLAFGADPASMTTFDLPFTKSGVSAYISFAFTPFVSSLAGISYTVMGRNGTFVFVLRWNNQRYADFSGYMNADILLYQSDSKVELRYYRVDRSSRPLTIGIFGNATNTVPNYSSFIQNSRISRTLSKVLRGSTLIFSTTRFIQPAPVNTTYTMSLSTSASLPSSPSALTGAFPLPGSNDGIDRINLGFIFRFFGAEYTAINIDANGEIQFATSTVDYTPDPMPLGNTALAPFLAFFYTDLYPNYAESRQYAYSGISYPNRVFTLRLNNVPYFATRFSSSTPPSVTIDIKLFELDGHIEVLYYRLDACDAQNVLVGIEGLPFLGSDWSADYNVLYNAVPASSTVTSNLAGKVLTISPSTPIGVPRYIPPNYYNVTTLASAPTRESMTGAMDLGIGTYVLYPNIALNFSFPFYGRNYSVVTISSNGNIQFTTQLYNYYAYPMPTGQSMGAFISFWMGYLYTSVTGRRLYKTFGIAPNRYFILRFDRHNYCCTDGDGPLSVDTVLFEDGRIEIRIFEAPSYANGYPILIGIQGSEVPRSDGTYDYTTVLNAVQMNTTYQNLVNNKAFLFQVSGVTNWTAPIPLNVSYRYQQSSYSAAMTPLVNPVYLRGSDEGVDTVLLGFGFRFFDKYYKTINVGSNGEIQFTTAYASRTVSAMPLTSSSRLPLLAFFYTDLYPTASTSKSYSTTGSYPNRIFTLRFSNVPYQNCRNSFVSIDVLLYEIDSHFEVIYYQVDPCTTQELLVGVQVNTSRRTDYSYDYLAPINQAFLQTSLATSLNGTRMIFTLTNPPTDLPPTFTLSSVGGTYNISWIPSVVARPSLPGAILFPTYYYPETIDIGFNFVFYGVPYMAVTITPNGVLQFASSTYAYNPLPVPSGNSAVFPYIAFAYTYQLYYSYYSERTYATFGNPGNRTFVIRFDNALYSYDQPGYATMDLWLFEIDNHIEMRYYSIDHTYLQTMLIGVQASTTDYAIALNSVVLTPPLAMMLSGSTVVIQGVNPIPPVEMRRVNYTVTRVNSVPARESMTNPISVFTSTTDNAVSARLTIGFSFPFYGINYTSLAISSNGNIQFGTRFIGMATTPTPLKIKAALPLISFAYTNLVIAPGAITYSSSGGSSPNRYFIIRANSVSYYYRTPVGNISVDCLLYENGTIEMRYYSVSATWQGMLIGLESRVFPDGNSDYTTVLDNDPLVAREAAALNGTTLIFNVASSIPYTPNPSIAPVVPRGYAYGTYNVSLISGTAPYVATLPGTPTYLQCCTYYVPINLGFGFVFMGRNYTSAYLDVNGRIGFRSGSDSTLSSAMPYGNSAFTPLIAFFWSSLYVWYYSNAVAYATYGSPGSRYFILRYNNIPYYVSPYNYNTYITADVYLYEVDGRIEIHYYRMDAMPDTVVIGVQGITSNDGAVDFAYLLNDGAVSSNLAAGLVGKTAVFQIASGRMEVTPTPYAPPTYNTRQISGALPIDMSGATYLLEADDSVTSVRLPFSFSFFNVSYSTVYISTNGNLQWATSSTQYTVNPLPDGNPNVEPLLATFMTDLYPYGPYVRSYKTFGDSPNRSFVVSFNLTGYCCSIGGTYPMVSFDTILYETTNVIEIRYRRVDPSTSRYVIIGVDNSRALSNGEPDYTVVYNVANINQALADHLANTTIFFEYAPPRVLSSSSSTGVAAISSSSSTSVTSSSSSSPIASSSSSSLPPSSSSSSIVDVFSSSSSIAPSSSAAPSSSVVPVVSSSSSSSSITPTLSSSSSSSSRNTASSTLPAGCILPQALPIVGHTIDIVFNSEFSIVPSNYMSVLLSAILETLVNAGYSQAANQIRCGILRSATASPNFVASVYSGLDSESVATIYVQSFEGGAQPEAIREYLVSMLSVSNNPINTRLIGAGLSPVTKVDPYKTCTNGDKISITDICAGETRNNGNADGSSSKLGSGAIAGIVIGVLCGVILLVVVICILLRRRGDKSGPHRFHDEEGEHSTNKMDSNQDSEDGVELATTHQAVTEDASEDYGGEVETQETEELV
jgi:hypothetical protein